MLHENSTEIRITGPIRNGSVPITGRIAMDSRSVLDELPPMPHEVAMLPGQMYNKHQTNNRPVSYFYSPWPLPEIALICHFHPAFGQRSATNSLKNVKSLIHNIIILIRGASRQQ